jgi:hypothetical protein
VLVAGAGYQLGSLYVTRSGLPHKRIVWQLCSELSTPQENQMEVTEHFLGFRSPTAPSVHY